MAGGERIYAVRENGANPTCGDASDILRKADGE